MRLNEMNQNLQTEKKWSNFAKYIDQKPFAQTLMAYIFFNIEVATNRVTDSESA